MSQIKDVLKNQKYMKYSIFIAFTMTLIYIIYFIISNFSIILQTTLGYLSSILNGLSPLFIGLFLAYLLHPLVTFIDRKFIRKISDKLIPSSRDSNSLDKFESRFRLASIMITYLFITSALLIVLYTFSFLIVGKFMITGIGNLYQTVVNYLLNYEVTLTSWVNTLEIDGLSETLNNIADYILTWLSYHLKTSSVLELAGSIGSSIVNILLGMVVSIYLLKDYKYFQNIWNKLLTLIVPEKFEIKLHETLRDIDGVASMFIRGALLDALIVAILSSIGLSILGLEFAVFIGCFAGLANIIPYFGPVLGMIPAFIVGAFTGGLSQGIIAVVVLLVIQQVDANIIYPKVVGSSTGLHPLFVLLSVTFAGSFWGIIGMILAVPVAAIIQVFILKWVSKNEISKIKEQHDTL